MIKLRYVDAEKCIPSFVMQPDAIKVIHKTSRTELAGVQSANADESWVVLVRRDGMPGTEVVETDIEIRLADHLCTERKLKTDIMNGVYYESDLTDDERVMIEREVMGEEKKPWKSFQDERRQSYKDFVRDITGCNPASLGLKRTVRVMSFQNEGGVDAPVLQHISVTYRLDDEPNTMLAVTAPPPDDHKAVVVHANGSSGDIMIEGLRADVDAYIKQLDDHFVALKCTTSSRHVRVQYNDVMSYDFEKFDFKLRHSPYVNNYD